MRRWLPAAAVVALVIAPAAGLGVLTLGVDDRPDALVVDPEPVLTQPTARLSDGEQQATLAFDLGDPKDLESGGAAGVVTAVYVEPGDTIGQGDALYAVDGVTRIAMGGPEPLYRALSAEDRGPDVKLAERYLSDLGFLEEDPDEFFGWKTVLATRAYESSVGVGDPTGVFSADLVLWLPESPFVVAEVLVEQGGQSPVAGEPLVLTPPAVRSAKLQSREGGGLSLAGPSFVEIGGEVVGEISDPAVIPSDIVRAAHLAAVSMSGAAETKDSVDVVLRLVEPRRSLVVPSSAVMVGDDGARTCVWVSDGAGFVATGVSVIGGTLGSTDVLGEIEDSEILVNPLDILRDATCQ